MLGVLTERQKEQVCAFLTRPELEITLGIGRDAEHACTIAAINLALGHRLEDERDPCMSPVIHSWVIRVQDAMPANVRNSQKWRQAACGIAGSAGGDETARLQLILDWMWNALGDEAVLAALPDQMRPSWDVMLRERTTDTAHSARVSYAPDAADAAYAADNAADAAKAASYAASAASAADVADAAAYAAYAVDAVCATAVAAYWERRNPATLLKQLCGI
jgi:hypothetical protein